MNCLDVPVTSGRDSVSGPRQVPTVDRRASADDHERFKSVVLPHLSDAYTLARWLIGNPSDSEDVVQDACLRAYRGIDGFANGNARAWVLTIVRHTAYNWLQKNRHNSSLSVDDLEAAERERIDERHCDTPETALVAQDRARQLQTAINALPTSFRETLLLRDVKDLTYRQIAAVTEVSIGTVMSRLARARGRVIADMRAIGYGQEFDIAT